MNYNWIVWYQWKYHISYEVWRYIYKWNCNVNRKDITRYQILLIKFLPIKNYLLFFFFFIVLLIKSYLSSVNSNTIHLQFDLFIINLFFLFTLIDRSIINTGLLKWFISFARINLDLLRDLVIQLLFVSFHFQYIYFSINFKINSRIDRSIENMKRYIFESQYIDRWSWIVQSDAKIELYRKS